MPLPIAGGGGRPTRPPTHTPLDMRRLMSVATELDDAVAVAADGDDLSAVLTPELVEELAADMAASEAYVYAAAALMTEIGCDNSDPVRFELCVGGCQGWGAIDLLKHLLNRHAQRRDDKQPTFGVVAKRCLDKCAHAPIVLLHTPDGTAGMPAATVAQLDEALAQVL